MSLGRRVKGVGRGRARGARGLAALAVLLALVPWRVGAQGAGRIGVVEQVAWEVSGKGARVVVVLRGKVDYSTHMASADPGQGLPPRAYVDLRPAQLGSQISREPIVVGDALVERIRIGQFDRSTVRIVVDLERPARFDVSTASDPPRIVLGLAPLPGPARAPAAAPARKVRKQVASVVAAPRSGSGRPRLRKPVPAARPTPKGSGAVIVVLDPGHGGRDPGARGVTGEPEKVVTLAVAERVAADLARRGGVEVVLTRSDDSTLSLEQRTAIANARGADLFVSIHANASRNRRTHGIETYTLNNTGDRATIRLAALENGLDLTGAEGKDGDLAYILSDLVQTGKEEESTTLARTLHQHLVAHLQQDHRGVEDLGVKPGPFYVLVGAYMPCVLVETGFLTHAEEGRRLASPRYREQVASGLADGILAFLHSSANEKTL